MRIHIVTVRKLLVLSEVKHYIWFDCRAIPREMKNVVRLYEINSDQKEKYQFKPDTPKIGSYPKILSDIHLILLLALM